MWQNRGRRGPPQSIPHLEPLESRNLLNAATDLQTALNNLSRDVGALAKDAHTLDVNQIGRDFAAANADMNAALSNPLILNSAAVVQDLLALQADGQRVGFGQEVMAIGSEILALAPLFSAIPPAGVAVSAVGGGVLGFGALEVSLGVGGAIADFQNLQGDAQLLVGNIQQPPPPPPPPPPTPTNQDPDNDGDVDMY